MQIALPQVIVTDLRGGNHPLTRVSYGPYMTTCSPTDVWSVKQEIKKLPIICPTCKRQATP